METVIAGAGPTGLLLAGDLAAAGVDVTVLERRAEESNLTRAFAVHARTLEQFDVRGIADEVIASGTKVARLRLFNKIGLDLGGLPSRFPFVVITPQYNVERVLLERAVKAGARILRGRAVSAVVQDADRVEVRTDGGETFTADYLVGTDGAHSAVRHALGLGFPGHAVVRSLMLADVRLAAPPEGVITVNAVGSAFAFVAPFGDGWYRVFAWNRAHQVSDDTPLELAEVRETVEAAFGTDFGMGECRWLSRFHSDERQVEQYRTGRVFLAGDAAHVHSPAGGQGMNTGLQDAANLGWKLAAAGAGWAPAGLLDTYHAERHAVGQLVLRTSGGIIRLALLQSRAARLGRDVLGNLALHVPAVLRRAAGTISGVGIDYPDTPRQADLDLAGGGRLYELLREGRHVLLGPRPVAGYEDRLVQAPLDRYILVRPDAFTAWTGTEGDVSVALRAHLGTPR